MKTHLIFMDAHAHYKHNNDRALWLGELINDVKPDVVIDGGDTADMPSLSGYDKGTRAAVGRSYKQDIDSHNEFQDKLWSRCRRSKKRLPTRVRLIGNHEQRIDRALDSNPALEGTVSYSDLQLECYYDEVVYYEGNTPGVITIDGINYSHYFSSGLLGRPVGGEHPAYTLIAKKHTSCTQGHSHVFDYCQRNTNDGKTIQTLIAPCFVDYKVDWAGQVQNMWSAGIIIKRNVDKGSYNLEIVSINTLKKQYA